MGKQWKQWPTIFLGAPKSLQMVTAAMKLKDAYSLEVKLWPTLIAYSKAETTLPTNVHLVKAMVFPVVIYECESWTVKKAEHWKTDAFELRRWRRLLRIPWTARRSNQSIHHYLHYLHHSLVSGQATGREQSPTHQQKNWIKDLLSMALPVRTDPAPTVSPSHQEASISLSSFSIRGQTDWTPQSQKTNQTDHMDHSLVQLNETMSHAGEGPPRQTGHAGEFWQNVVHWRGEWQTTSVFVPGEPHEQYEKAKR